MSLYQIIEQNSLYTIFEVTTLETATDVVYDDVDLYKEDCEFGKRIEGSNGKMLFVSVTNLVNYVKRELKTTKTVEIPELNHFSYGLSYTKVFKENGIAFSMGNKHFKKYAPPKKKPHTSSKQLLNTFKRELCYLFRTFVKEEYDVYIKIEDLTMTKTFDKSLQMAFKLGFDINKISTISRNNVNVTKTYREWLLYLTITRQYEQTVVDLTLKEFDNWYNEQLLNYNNK